MSPRGWIPLAEAGRLAGVSVDELLAAVTAGDLIAEPAADSHQITVRRLEVLGWAAEARPRPAPRKKAGTRSGLWNVACCLACVAPVVPVWFSASYRNALLMDGWGLIWTQVWAAAILWGRRLYVPEHPSSALSGALSTLACATLAVWWPLMIGVDQMVRLVRT